MISLWDFLGEIFPFSPIRWRGAVRTERYRTGLLVSLGMMLYGCEDLPIWSDDLLDTYCSMAWTSSAAVGPTIIVEPLSRASPPVEAVATSKMFVTECAFLPLLRREHGELVPNLSSGKLEVALALVPPGTLFDLPLLSSFTKTVLQST
jgi:hypothetical protein